MKNLQNIEPSIIFKNFSKISEIPRGSGNEKGISDFLVNFAKKLNLEVIQDEALNVIIKKPATKGYENAPTVIIQGHMDMVCEKNNETIHDFNKDPLKLVVDGDKIYAEGTTLGADDGIAVAYAMALLEDNNIEHPALEILLTTDEETGMTGAMNIRKEHLKGEILINIDTEEEGYLLVSCAGGIRTRSAIKLEKEKKEKNGLEYKIKVKGLKGGHSGTDIDKWRGNSNKILGRILKEIFSKFEYRLISINGGSKNNAIPRESEGIIFIDEKYKDVLKDTVNEMSNIIKNELINQDPGLNIILEENISDNNEIISLDCTKRIINLLYLYPNGVNTMSTTIENLTESSTNLGIVKTYNEEIEFDSAVRSSITSLKNDIVNKIKSTTEILGGEFSANAGYPAWEYKKDSKAREICLKVYKEMTGEDMKVYAIHAGVECGLFQEKLGAIDMVSFGPDIRDAHTPEENLSISSTKRVWEYLLEVLKNIK